MYYEFCIFWKHLKWSAINATKFLILLCSKTTECPNPSPNFPKFQLFSLQICDYYSCNITEFTKSFDDLEEIREAVGWLRFFNQSFQTETPLKMLLEGRCKFYHVGVTSWWLVACSLLVAAFLFVNSSKKPMDFRAPDFVTQTLFLHSLMLDSVVSWGDTAET